MRVEVIQCAAAGIPAVEGVLRGTGTLVVGAEVNLPVGNACKRARLVNYAAYGVGETAACNAVEYHRTYGNFAGVTFAARFAVNATGQQIQVAVANFVVCCRAAAARPGRQRNAHCLCGGVADYAVGSKPVFALKVLYGALRLRTEDAVHAAGVVTPPLEFGLYGAHGLTATAHLDYGCVGGNNTADYKHRGKGQHSQRQRDKPDRIYFRQIFPPCDGVCAVGLRIV